MVGGGFISLDTTIFKRELWGIRWGHVAYGNGSRTGAIGRIRSAAVRSSYEQQPTHHVTDDTSTVLN